jgi:hypothetical protein
MQIRRNILFVVGMMMLGPSVLAQQEQGAAEVAVERWPVGPDTLEVVGWPEAPAMQGQAYGPGEVLRYGFSYGFLNAAEGVVTVREGAGSGERGTVEVEARGKSVGAFSWFFKIDDSYRSVMDAETGLPVRFLRDVHEGGYELKQDYRFDWEKRTVFDGDDHWLLEEPMYDMVSAIYAMRERNLEGLAANDTLSIVTWVDGERFDLKMLFDGRAMAEVEEGTWRCLAFQPLIQTGRIWESSEDLMVYISDDQNRIPILVESRLRFGTVRMELQGAEGLKNLTSRTPE